MNIPNTLTIIRIILTPLMVIFILQDRMGAAFLTFLAAGLTDALDGLLARYLKQKTEIGAILDPMADKLLLATSYVTLASTHMVPAWLAVVVISRDLIIVIGVLLLFLLKGGVEIKPSIVGKLTTFLQLVTILCLFIFQYFGALRHLLDPLYWTVTASTVLSGFHYLGKGIKLL